MTYIFHSEFAMRLPLTLPLPSCDDYPFMDAYIKRQGNLDFARNLSLRYLKIYDAIGKKTFMSLCSLLSPELYGIKIRSKEQIDSISEKLLSTHLEYDVDDSPTSLEHFKAHIFFASKKTKNPSWKRIADLYNNSSNDQKAAIFLFFKEVVGVDILYLYEKKFNAITAPKSLTEDQKLLSIDGEEFICTEENNKWIRADLFKRKIEVIHHFDEIESSYEEGEDVTYTYRSERVVAFAGTLVEAIAKSTIFAKTLKSDENYFGDIENHGDEIVLMADETLLGGAKVVINKNLNGDSDISLEWNLEHFRHDVAALEKMAQELSSEAAIESSWDNFSTAESLESEAKEIRDRLKYSKSNVPHNEFKKVLYQVESTLGVEWSKVKHLEDELGL